MNKVLRKISGKLENHGSIIMACSSFGCKKILTLEKDINMYWIRFYRDGDVARQEYWQRFALAKKIFYCYKINHPEFKYNNYDGGLKHYEHK